ncbi:MAG: hypothetical protein GY772_21125 [bacterium]|nr:hypothetical protein [bacterium]
MMWTRPGSSWALLSETETTLALAAVAGSSGGNERETGDVRFRAGSTRNAFDYCRSHYTFGDHRVWVCSRGSGLEPGMVYWLYRSSSGQWLCVEAIRSSTDPISEGIPQFRTIGSQIRDISEPAEALLWQYWNTASGSWEGKTSFPTVRI